MRRSSLVVALVLGALTALCAPTARADSGEQCWCSPDSHHPNEPVACDGGCYCFDSCAGSAPAAAGPSRAAKATGSVAMLLALFVAPGHALALFAPDGDLGAFADPKHSAAQWKIVRGRILAATKQAKALREKREQLAAAERAATAAPVAPTTSRLTAATQPVPRKAELPLLSYQCDSARFQIAYQTFPLAGFDNIGAYRDQCKPEPPAGKDSIAQKDASGMCPGGSYTCPDQCCPPGYPILNLCDKQCYKTSDFMGGSDVGLVCTRYVNCAYWAPAK